MNLSQFVALLGDKKFVPRAEQRSELASFASHVVSARDSLTPEDRQWFVIRLKPLTRLPNKFKAALASQLLYWFTKSPSALINGIRSALIDGSSIEGRVANMNSLGAMFFNAAEGASILGPEVSRPRMKAYYLETVAMIRQLLAQRKITTKQRFEHNNRLVILTQQFLVPTHAPTKDALDFARLFRSQFGLDVLIVSTCEFNPYPAGSVLPLFLGNANESYAQLRAIEYNGESYPYFQPPIARFFPDSIAACVERVEAFDPSMVLVVGGRNLLSEMFIHRAFVMLYPTTSFLPMCHGPFFFFYGRPPNEAEVAQLNAEGIADHCLFHQHPGFEPPQQTTTLERKSLGIPDDAFVFVVVGSRLRADVKPDFLDLLEAIVALPKAHIVFAGYFEGYDDVVVRERQKLAGRTTFVGFQSDIMALYALCNVCLNPKRVGGGSSVVQAMAAGLPALSCPVGDGYEAARNLPLIPDYADMAVVAKTLAQDPEQYAHWQSLAKAQADRLCSRLPLVERIMQSYDHYRNEMESREEQERPQSKA